MYMVHVCVATCMYIPAKSIVVANTFDAVFGNDKWKILHDCTIARDSTAFTIISWISLGDTLQSCGQILGDRFATGRFERFGTAWNCIKISGDFVCDDDSDVSFGQLLQGQHGLLQLLFGFFSFRCINTSKQVADAVHNHQSRQGWVFSFNDRSKQGQQMVRSRTGRVFDAVQQWFCVSFVIAQSTSGNGNQSFGSKTLASV